MQKFKVESSAQRYSANPRGGRSIKVLISGSVEVKIDLEPILQEVAQHALANKSGKAKLLGGYVTAKVLTRSRTEVPEPEA